MTIRARKRDRNNIKDLTRMVLANVDLGLWQFLSKWLYNMLRVINGNGDKWYFYKVHELEK